MPEIPFGVVRPRLFTDNQLAVIHEAAVAILLDNCIEVKHARACEAAARAGLRVIGNRIRLERAVIEEFVTHYLSTGKEQAAPSEPPSADITLNVHRYPQHVHDLATDAIKPFTTAALIEATKLIDVLTESGVRGAAPGIPADVPGDLEHLLQYKISAQYCREAKRSMVIRNARMLPYAMEMTEALDCPLRGFGIYVVTPFRLGGEFLDVLMAKESGLTYVTVHNMTSVGAAVPIRLPDALAFAAAEVIGCAIVLRKITSLEVDWSLRVCPIDMRSLAFSLGSPEEILFQLATDEVNAFYHGRAPGPPACTLHTQAKLPNPQAGSELMAQMTFAALCGTRSFGGAGALSVDEIFSAEQLLLDCEMRDHTSRLVRGIDPNCDAAGALAEATQGIAEGTFAGLDSTAALARQIYWSPRLFERRSLGGWLNTGQQDLHRQVKDMVHTYIAQHNYELEPGLLHKLDAIYARAYRELA
jgi:trimethylamine---corrinoid protein Co-methyltransferase